MGFQQGRADNRPVRVLDPPGYKARPALLLGPRDTITRPGPTEDPGGLNIREGQVPARVYYPLGSNQGPARNYVLTFTSTFREHFTGTCEHFGEAL